MNALLQRDSYTPQRKEWVRIAAIAPLLMGAALVWHICRDAILYRLACSSVGCSGRSALLAAAFVHKNPVIGEQLEVGGHSLPRPGWVVAEWHGLPITRRHGAQLPRWRLAVANHRLEVMGQVAGGLHPEAPPGDIDGDGCWEVVFDCAPYEFDSERDLSHWIVLRLRETRNEVVWLGYVNKESWAARNIRVKPIWRDEDGDGLEDFVFVTMEVIKTGPRSLAFKPPKTVAVFEWSGPGGILRPRLLPTDSGITSWTPPDDEPLPIDQEADLDQVIRTVQPVPGLRPRTK